MRRRRRLLTVLAAATALLPAATGAQTRPPSEAECQRMRERLAEHARASDGVRRAVAARAAALGAPRPSPAPRAGRPSSQEAARARLAQIPAERQRLEEQRLGALVQLQFSRAAEIQGQIAALEAEQARLERELATAPAAPPPAPAPPAAPAPAGADVDRLPCGELAALLDGAVRTRQRELGAREGQAGVVPLIRLRAQGPDDIARELEAQFAPWPGAGEQVGLLDQDGDGRLDAFGDVPADGVYRLYRLRSDGSIAVEVFALPPRGTWSDVVRRVEEAAIRRGGLALGDLLAARPAGAVRTLVETADFARTRSHFGAGNFADAAKLDGAAARHAAFPNWRGETVRVLEAFTPLGGGLGHRTVVIRPQPGGQELWEETTTVIRPVSYWRTDVEVTVTRQSRTAAGAPIGSLGTSGPIKFSVER